MPLSNSQQGKVLPAQTKRPKAKNFLHSAAIRDFTHRDIQKMTEDDAFRFFQKLRWGSLEYQTCARCGTVDKHYYKRTRKRWLCKHCFSEFSVTTGTVLQDRKIEFTLILKIMLLFVTSSKGKASLDAAREQGLGAKSAFVLLSKLRELLVITNYRSLLEGTVHVDGAHFCGKPRRPNRRRKPTTAMIEAKLKESKKSRSGRNRPKYNEKRRIIMSLRQLGEEPRSGAVRSIAYVCLAENEANAIALAKKHIRPGSIVMTDENPSYTQYSANYDHRTVQHSREYCTEDGTNNNQAESFNSRMRRAEYGIYHGFRAKYLADYLQQYVWLEDMRRKTNLQKLQDLFARMAMVGKSNWWRGYWQGHHREGELLFGAT